MSARAAAGGRTILGKAAQAALTKGAPRGVTGYALMKEMRTVTEMLTGGRMPVHFQGERAFTDGNMIVLPAVEPTQIYPDEVVKVLRGYRDHESGHKLYTDWPLVLDLQQKGGALVAGRKAKLVAGVTKLAHKVGNIIEDAMLERRIVDDYPGTRANLDALRCFSVRRSLALRESGKLAKRQRLRHDILNALLFVANRTNGWSCMEENDRLIEELRARRPMAVEIAERWEAGIAGVRTSAEAHALSYEVVCDIVGRLLRDDADDPQPPPPPEEHEQQGPPPPQPHEEQGPEEVDEPSDPDEDPDQDGGEGPGDDGAEPPQDEPPEGDDEPDGADGDEGPGPESEAGSGPDDLEGDDEEGSKGAGDGSGRGKGQGTGEEADVEPPPEGDAETPEDPEGGDESGPAAPGEDASGEDVDADQDDGPGGDAPGEEATDGTGEGERTEGDHGQDEPGQDEPGEGEPGEDQADGLDDLGDDEPADGGEDQRQAGGGRPEAGAKPSGGDAGDDATGQADGSTTDGDDGDEVADGGTSEGGAGAPPEDGAGTPSGRGGPATPGADADGGDDGAGDDEGADAPSAADDGEAGEGGAVDGDGEGDDADAPDESGEEALSDDGEDEPEATDVSELAKAIAGLTKEQQKLLRAAFGGVPHLRCRGVNTTRHEVGASPAREPVDGAVARSVRTIALADPKMRVLRRQEDGVLDDKNVIGLSLRSTDVYKRVVRHPAVETDWLFLVDQSGSMMTVMQMVMALVNSLAQASFTVPTLKTSIVSYTSRPNGRGDGIVLEIHEVKDFADTPARARGRIADWMRDPGEFGYTPTAEAMHEAAERLMRRKAHRRILSLVTDGEPDEAPGCVAAHLMLRRMGITTSVVEIGGHHLPHMPFDAGVVAETLADLPRAMTEMARQMLR